MSLAPFMRTPSGHLFTLDYFGQGEGIESGNLDDLSSLGWWFVYEGPPPLRSRGAAQHFESNKDLGVSLRPNVLASEFIDHYMTS
jgi:hypothetical protein